MATRFPNAHSFHAGVTHIPAADEYTLFFAFKFYCCVASKFVSGDGCHFCVLLLGNFWVRASSTLFAIIIIIIIIIIISFICIITLFHILNLHLYLFGPIRSSPSSAWKFPFLCLCSVFSGSSVMIH